MKWNEEGLGDGGREGRREEGKLRDGKERGSKRKNGRRTPPLLILQFNH